MWWSQHTPPGTTQGQGHLCSWDRLPGKSGNAEGACSFPGGPLDTQSCRALLAAAQARLRGAADGSWVDLAGAVLVQPIVPVTMEKQMLIPALLKKQRQRATWGTALCLKERGLGMFDHTRAQVFPQIPMPPKSSAAAS